MKYLKIDDTVLVNYYPSTVCSLPNKDGEMQLILDEGLLTETTYSCNIRDISTGDDGDFVLDVEFSPTIGDIVRVNEEEHKLIAIDSGVVTIQRDDVVSYYSLSDVNYDIVDGFWVSSISQQVRSPTVKRKLEVYEVQKEVYEYKSLCELREIYTLLGQPTLYNIYGLKYNDYNTFIDSLQSNFGLLVFWTEFDTEYGYEYKYIKIIDGAIIEERKCNESKI